MGDNTRKDLNKEGVRMILKFVTIRLSLNIFNMLLKFRFYMAHTPP